MYHMQLMRYVACPQFRISFPNRKWCLKWNKIARVAFQFCHAIEVKNWEAMWRRTKEYPTAIELSVQMLFPASLSLKVVKLPRLNSAQNSKCNTSLPRQRKSLQSDGFCLTSALPNSWTMHFMLSGLPKNKHALQSNLKVASWQVKWHTYGRNEDFQRRASSESRSLLLCLDAGLTDESWLSFSAYKKVDPLQSLTR